MIGIDLGLNHEKPVKVLCLGAHCDDIEIGCGGTLLRIMQANPNISVKWVVLTSNKERESEALKSARLFLKNAAKHEISIKNFRDGFLPYTAVEVKDYFEEIKREFNPDIIFTHFRDDSHQDHRLINELTWSTFRNHLILEYEIPKYDGDLGHPNFFIPLSREDANEKIDLLLDNFQSQANKHWFDKETFLSIMRLRGMESPSESKYSEAFYIRKAVLQN